MTIVLSSTSYSGHSGSMGLAVCIPLLKFILTLLMVELYLYCGFLSDKESMHSVYLYPGLNSIKSLKARAVCEEILLL